MSFKAKIAAGAATFALAGGGLGAVGTLSASAATPSCGTSCADVYTLKFGSHFLLDTFQGKAAADQEVILFQASNSDPAEDFVPTDLGKVWHLYSGGKHSLITKTFAHRYGSDEAWEYQYAPLGLKSGFCASTWPGVIAQPGYKVRLEPCGRYSNSIWATDQHPDGDHTASAKYWVVINAATDSFSNPLVLNYPAGNPTDMPRPWVNVEPLNAYGNGTVFDNQQWSYRPGPVHGGMHR